MKKVMYLFCSAFILMGVCVYKISVSETIVEGSNDQIKTNDSQISSDQMVLSSSSIENLESSSGRSPNTSETGSIPEDYNIISKEEVIDKKPASSTSEVIENFTIEQNIEASNEQRTSVLNWDGTSGSITLTLDSNGILHIPGGEIENPQRIVDITGISINSIKKIAFDGPLKLKGSIKSLFSDMDIESYEGLSLIDISLVTDMDYLFSKNRNITSLDLSSFDTSNITDMSSLFADCWSLTSLNFSGWNTSKVTSIESLFYNCVNLVNLDLSSFDTHNVINFEQFIYNCDSLTNLDVSTFDTSNAVDMAFMFAYNTNLKSLDLRNFDVSKVRDMESMFRGCFYLENLDVSNWDISNVSFMNDMFSASFHLTSLDLSNWDLSTSQKTEGMFFLTPIKRLLLGSSTQLNQNMGLEEPESSSKFTGLWQTMGTGTEDKPNGTWSGSTADLISRSMTGISDTYVWEPVEMVNVVFPIEVSFHSKKQSNQQIIEPAKLYTIENKSTFSVKIQAINLVEVSNPNGLQLLTVPDEDNKKGLLLNLTEGTDSLGTLTNSLNTNPIDFSDLSSNDSTTLGFSGYYYGDTESKQQVQYQLTFQVSRKD
ncbi:BspA family leucine-rich repeat surface protein [Carnobacterium maltaromaticum]|uniref:BspA family leucine-rich repeat surface protein n=1 Tax=Carnobacterium maltaromaticum TaxID=2751 RepID=UPI00026C8D8D|nr:BspA family leucine-rich repeat surface protein [Carnobacterium maltaromaticum]